MDSTETTTQNPDATAPDIDSDPIGKAMALTSKRRGSKRATPVPDPQTAESPVAHAEPPDTNRPGAPDGNTNALKHGLRSGKFPPGTEYLTKQIGSFRKVAEAAILDARGQLGFYETALLQSAIEHYSHGLRVRRWLRVGWNDLNVDQRLAYSREIARAFSERDKVLKQLGVDAQADNGKATLYALPMTSEEPAPPAAVDGGHVEGDAATMTESPESPETQIEANTATRV